MNILKRPHDVEIHIADPQERYRRVVGIRVCSFANGKCECRDRRHLCARVENEAAAIIEAMRHMEGSV